ncbi:hypothetical protein ABN244_22465, partial [Escherichia coli]
MAVVDGDTNVIREYDSDDADFGIYNAGEKVTLLCGRGNDSNLLIVFYVQIMPDDFVMQLHR